MLFSVKIETIDFFIFPNDEMRISFSGSFELRANAHSRDVTMSAQQFFSEEDCVQRKLRAAQRSGAFEVDSSRECVMVS